MGRKTWLKKLAVLGMMGVMVAIAATIYGSLVIQLTYSLSPDYYWAILFVQDVIVESPPEIYDPVVGRLLAMIYALHYGFMGFLLTMLMSLIAWQFPTATTMLKQSLWMPGLAIAASIAVFGISFAIPLTDFSAWIGLSLTIPDLNLPTDPIWCVQWIHYANLSGAIAGMLLAIRQLCKKIGNSLT